MLDKLKQMMEVKRQADQLKKELDVSFIDVNEIEGIKLNISGSQKLVSVEIDKNLLTESNKEKLQSDLLISFNAAIKKSQDLAAQKMKNLTGLNIPGF